MQLLLQAKLQCLAFLNKYFFFLYCKLISIFLRIFSKFFMKMRFFIEISSQILKIKILGLEHKSKIVSKIEFHLPFKKFPRKIQNIIQFDVKLMKFLSLKTALSTKHQKNSHFRIVFREFRQCKQKQIA